MVKIVHSLSELVSVLTSIIADVDTDRSVVIMLCGQPASGKSTARMAISHADFDGRVVSVVCPDDIRKSLCGDEEDQSRNRQVWQVAYSDVERLVGMRGTVTVFDATLSHVRDRRGIVRLSDGAFVLTVWLDTSLDECFERNMGRDRHVPDDVIRRMHESLVLNPPTRDDFVDGVVVLR